MMCDPVFMLCISPKEKPGMNNTNGDFVHKPNTQITLCTVSDEMTLCCWVYNMIMYILIMRKLASHYAMQCRLETVPHLPDNQKLK